MQEVYQNPSIKDIKSTTARYIIKFPKNSNKKKNLEPFRQKRPITYRRINIKTVDLLTKPSKQKVSGMTFLKS